MSATAHPNHALCIGLDVLLPGPDRKRTSKAYHYHLTYRRPEPDALGCVMTWEVQGGRLPYQIALDCRDPEHLEIHCTCADAIYRGDQAGHRCKHVEGFLEFGRMLPGAEEPTLRRSA